MSPLGIDYEQWHTRAAHLGLGPEDVELLRRVRCEAIEPRIEEIVARFRTFLAPLYDQLPAFDRDFVLSRQRDFLLKFGRGFGSDAYVDERILIGEAHVRWSIPLSDYALAHHHLQCLILEVALSAGFESTLLPALTQTVCRITALDMALVIHAYHRTHVRSLERRLATQVSETRRFRIDASRDSLTGLLNRRGIEVALQQAILEAREKGRPLLIGIADLDRFKRVNDTHGHLVGDQVLQITARRMSQNLRKERDALGRWGGEEFLLLLGDTSPEVGREVGERIRRAICDTPIGADGLEIPISLSLGLSALAPDDDLSSLIGRADEALYRAKAGGRNRVELLGLSAP